MQKTHTILDKILFISVLFMLLAGCGSSGGDAGKEDEAVSLEDVMKTSEITVARLSDDKGNPILGSKITIPISGKPISIGTVLPSITIKKDDPVNGLGTCKLEVQSVKTDATGTQLMITARGLIPQTGTDIDFETGTVSFDDKTVLLPGSISFTAPSQPSIQETSMTQFWFNPTDLSLFPAKSVNGGLRPEEMTVDLSMPIDDAGVEAKLITELQSMVDTGELKPAGRPGRETPQEEMAYRLALHQDSRVRFNMDQPQTIARILATNSVTLLDSLIGDPDTGTATNSTGVPAIVIMDDLGDASAAKAFMLFNPDGDGQDRLLIALNNSFLTQPLYASNPAAEHEVHHNEGDVNVGQSEEVIAKTQNVITWADMLLRRPELANTGYKDVVFSNAEVLALLQSGVSRGSGISRSPFLEESKTFSYLTGSRFEDTESLEGHARVLYAALPEQAVPNPGTAHLLALINRVSAQEGASNPMPLPDYGPNTISRYFNQGVLQPGEAYKLAATLALELQDPEVICQ